MSMGNEQFDYIIVGAGSAGCVLANRLTESGVHRVLVLEYGGSDRSIFVQMPTALSIPMNMPRYNWGYHSEREPGLGGRQLHTPRGKVLGGSSSINGLVYIRGNAQDFNGWQDQGASGWSYADVLPYFRRAETRMGGGDAYRGDGGPLQTRYGQLTNPLHAAWLQAAAQAGYPRSQDLNGFQQEGFGRFDMTVGGGRRCSAANAYLRPAMQRPNLEVRTQALATRIVLEGRRAVAVEYRRGGSTQRSYAAREVIVAAGPINTPQLLKLSGVGPSTELQVMGIPARRGREPAGSPGILFPDGLYPTGQPLCADERLAQGADWHALDPAQGWTRRNQSFRDRRFHPQSRWRAVPGHPVSFPADGGQL
jgi:choline dehydrogenase